MIDLNFRDQAKEKELMAYMRHDGLKWCAKCFSSPEAAALVHDHISVFISFRKLPYQAFLFPEMVIIKRVKQ